MGVAAILPHGFDEREILVRPLDMGLMQLFGFGAP
jgi:hypothetical protein